jgi:DNA-binding IclR family transcriptional regulator
MPRRSSPEKVKKRKTQSAKGANGNRSVVVGVHLLKTIAAIEGPATLGEIAVQAGMSASRTHRYLAGLIQTGLVEQDQNSGRYALGATIVELGLTALGRTDAVKLGVETLNLVTERTGLVSLLSTWGSHGPTIIKWEQGRLNTAVRIREGRNLPLLTTATGRVFLAFMPESELKDLLAHELARQTEMLPKSKAMDMSDVQALRAEVLRHGLGRMIGEENPGLVAVAAPVFDHDGRIVMTITLVSIIGTVDVDYDGAPARELKAIANQLSRRLGAPLPMVRAAGETPPLIKKAATRS